MVYPVGMCVCVCVFVKSAAGKTHGGKSLLIQSRPDMSIFLFFSRIFIFLWAKALQQTHPSDAWCNRPHHCQGPVWLPKGTCLIPAAANVLLGLHGCQINKSLNVTALRLPILETLGLRLMLQAMNVFIADYDCLFKL